MLNRLACFLPLLLLLQSWGDVVTPPQPPPAGDFTVHVQVVMHDEFLRKVPNDGPVTVVPTESAARFTEMLKVVFVK